MNKSKLVRMAFGVFVLFLWGNPLLAVFTPVDPGQSEVLVDPDPAVFAWNSSIAYYNDQLIYAGSDKKIYAYDINDGSSTLISDTSALSDEYSSVSGFLVSNDNYLYFHENTFPTVKIYRVLLTDSWPADYQELDTGCNGSIFSLTQNPWTDVIWFASADFGGPKMYLYEVKGFASTTERASFVAPNGGANGPIIFTGVATLLYGEYDYINGHGYFHLVDSTTGSIIEQDYLVLLGGLSGAAYGYNNVIYATSGGGKTIYEMQGNATTAVATSDDDAQGIAFDGDSFYVSTQVPFTPPAGDPGDGSISFHKVWNPDATISILPISPYRARYLGDPDPAVFAWNSAIAYYDNQLIYAGSDKRIYAVKISDGSATLVSDTSALSDEYSSVSGFLVSNDDYLYFHENAFPTVKIYRVLLTDPWPADYHELDSGCNGSIFSLTQNPWTDVIWFASADLGTGMMYLYDVNAVLDTVTERASFAAPNGGGNGPIIFEAENTLLYGESVWGGDGYFHLVDASTGNITDQDYLVFAGGLAGATYGYENVIYATCGGGKTVYEIPDGTMTEVATTTDDAQGIVFDGGSFYVSTLATTSGTVSGQVLWRLIPTGVPAGQEAPDGAVEGDLAVNVEGEDGSEAVGISAGDSHTFVEYLESVDPDDIEEQTNRPERLPFGLMSFRLKVTSPEGIAAATVHLSKKAPEGSTWYRHDSIKGWLDYSDHATLSADRESFALEFKDGGYGDADRIVNGYITDPGGVGARAGGGGGGGGSCFITAAGSGLVLNKTGTSLAIFALTILAGGRLVLRELTTKE